MGVASNLEINRKIEEIIFATIVLIDLPQEYPFVISTGDILDHTRCIPILLDLERCKNEGGTKVSTLLMSILKFSWVRRLRYLREF